MAKFLKILRADKNGGKIEADVFFGQAQYGEYTLKLFDENGKNGKLIAEGNNIDDLPDRFQIPIPPKQLGDQTLSWMFSIAAPDDKEGQLYFARITFLQGGQTLDDSPFEYSGELKDAKLIIGVAQILTE
jgi:hypothetical protein